MKKLLVLLTMVLAFNLSNAQQASLYDLSEITLTTENFTYTTQQGNTVNVFLKVGFKDDKYEPSAAITDEELRSMLVYTMKATQQTLKSAISYTPTSFIVTIKPNSKGKHKYQITSEYEATNSYGGYVKGFVTITLKEDKITETAGSVMLRL